MPFFLLHHQHEAHECAAAFAAWQGFASPLRHSRAPSSCLAGGHGVWWRVEATDHQEALALLPRFVAQRTKAISQRSGDPMTHPTTGRLSTPRHTWSPPYPGERAGCMLVLSRANPTRP
jgi:hypothetical protein